MEKLGVLVTNDIKNDSRVKKFSETLSRNFDVKTIGIDKKKGLYSNNNHKVVLISLRSSNKIFKYIEFAFKSIKELKECKIVHCNDIDTLPIGIVLKFMYSVKLVYDAHELESKKNGMSSFMSYSNYLIEKLLIRYVDLFITVNKSISIYYKQNFKIKDCAVIPNYPFYFETKPNFNDSGTLNFLYLGGISKGRGLEFLVNFFIENSKYNFDIIGYGQLEKIISEKTQKYHNIRVLDPVAMIDIPLVASKYDMGFCIIEKTCLSYELSLPNKFFEYIMGCLPVISNDLIETSKIIEKHNIGKITKLSSNHLLNIINDLSSVKINDMKKRINSEMRKKYSWEIIEKKIYSLYDKL